MTDARVNETHKQIGQWLRFGVIAGTAAALLVVVYDTDRNPRTDDASVRANFIAIAPEVSGRLVKLPVKDNAFVRKGDLLFEIDPRDYRYALQQALADQDNLEQRIIDTRRKIAAENSAVQAAGATVRTSVTGIKTAGSAVQLAKATVARAQAAVDAANAHLTYAINDFHRVEPLLVKQYVTVDQVDQAGTAVRVATGEYEQAQAALAERKLKSRKQNCDNCKRMTRRWSREPDSHRRYTLSTLWISSSRSARDSPPKPNALTSTSKDAA